MTDYSHFRVTPHVDHDGGVTCDVDYVTGNERGAAAGRLGEDLSLPDALDLLDTQLRPWGQT